MRPALPLVALFGSALLLAWRTAPGLAPPSVPSVQQVTALREAGIEFTGVPAELERYWRVGS